MLILGKIAISPYDFWESLGKTKRLDLLRSSLFVWSLANLLPAARTAAGRGRVVASAARADVPAEPNFDRA